MAYIAITISKQDDSKKDEVMRWLEYEITMDKDNNVWITNQDGEGGEFNCEKLFDVIDKFFKDHY